MLGVQGSSHTVDHNSPRTRLAGRLSSTGVSKFDHRHGGGLTDSPVQVLRNRGSLHSRARLENPSNVQGWFQRHTAVNPVEDEFGTPRQAVRVLSYHRAVSREVVREFRCDVGTGGVHAWLAVRHQGGR